jgi:hypothetical protein
MQTHSSQAALVVDGVDPVWHEPGESRQVPHPGLTMVGQVREKVAMHGHWDPSPAIASAPMISALLPQLDQPSPKRHAG